MSEMSCSDKKIRAFSLILSTKVQWVASTALEFRGSAVELLIVFVRTYNALTEITS